jgi:hypothetical protein
MSTDNNNNNKTAAAAAAAKPPPTTLGVSDNTLNNRSTGLKYINWYLTEAKPFGDDGIETFDQLTPSHVEGGNLQKFIIGFYAWLASRAFWTTQQTWLSTDQKVQYQKNANR